MKIPHTYDAVFQDLSKQSGIPPAFLKSLAWHESKFDPLAVSPTGVLGMWQVTDGARNLYNKQNNAKFARDDMTDPYKEGLVACWLLTHILDEYRSTGTIPAEAWPTFWSQPGGVGLLYLGYTSGWTREGGVANIVPRMRAAHVDVSVNKVIDSAGIYFPKSKIYVDPVQKDPHTKLGPYMSDPGLRKHIAVELDDYLVLATENKSEDRTKRSGLLMASVIGLVVFGVVITAES